MQECLQKYIAMSIIKQRLKEEKYAYKYREMHIWERIQDVWRQLYYEVNISSLDRL